MRTERYDEEGTLVEVVVTNEEPEPLPSDLLLIMRDPRDIDQLRQERPN